MPSFSPIRALLDRTIGTKVLLAFGVVLLTTAALGGFSVDRLGRVNAAAAEIRDSYLPATRLLGEIGTVSFRYRQLEAAHILASTPAGKAAEGKTIEEMAQQVAAAITAYQPLPRTAEDARIAAGFPGAWQDYRAMSRRLLALSAADQSAEATRLYTGEMRSVFNRFKDQVAAAMDGATLQGTAAADRGQAVYVSARSVTFAAIGFAVLLGALAWGGIVATVARPIRRMTDIMRRLAGRELAVAIPDQDRRDELGQMAGAVAVFKAGLIEADRLAAAERDNEERRRAERAREMDRLATAFEGKVGRVVQDVMAAAGQLQATAHAMAGAARDATARSAAVAAGATEASANVQTVATAAEELSASIGEIAAQVTRSSTTAIAATREAEASRSNVDQLAQAAEKIGEVVDHDQRHRRRRRTCSRSTPRSRRRGPATPDKGFAVVASEVKALAGQTARATDEIGTQITAMQQATGQTVAAIQTIGGDHRRCWARSPPPSPPRSRSRAAATREIAGSVQQAARGTEDVSRNVAGVQQAANDTGVAADQVLGAAGTLTRYADDLHGEVQAFLVQVRADPRRAA